MNKDSGGDGIPVELFQILKDDAVKVLHSIYQQIWKTEQWPQDWKKSVIIPVQRKAMPKNIQVQFGSVTRVRLFATPWTAARQAFLSITSFWNLHKLMYIESVMPSNCLILCCRLLLLPSIFPTIRVFSNESVLRIRWPKYCSFSFNISPSNTQD